MTLRAGRYSRWNPPVGDRNPEHGVECAAATPHRPRVAYLSLHRTVAGQGGNTHIYEIQHGLRALGWSVESFVPDDASGSLQRVRQFLLPQLRLILRARGIDVVYARHHPLAVVVALWCRWRNVPRVEEINGTLEDWYEIYPGLRRVRSPFEGLARFCLRSADGVVAVNDGLASWARQHGAHRIVEIIPNAADPDAYPPRTERPAGDQPPYVAYAGALTPWEGVETVLDAVTSPGWPVGVRVVIAGGGPLEERVRTVARDCPHLEWVGVLSRQDVADLLAGAAAALSPFWKPPYGASPIKLYEAMASGTPIIASNSPGQAEVVRAEECGVVFPPGDARAMCDAVRRIVDDPDAAEAMGRRGREGALARHSWAERSDRTNRVLERIIGRSAAPPEL